MGNEAMMKIIMDLIEEVKEENKGKLLSESLIREEVAVDVERKALKQYVTKNLIDTLKKSEK